MSQALRPSQFITTFGPGALIETPFGPHILQGTNEVLRRIHNHGIPMEDIAIRDMRLQQGLLEGARIFKMPDSRTWRNFVYPTYKFPRWNLCVQHTDRNVIHRRDDGCPLCPAGRPREDSKKNKFAIRFLVACPRGHLDDVAWHYLIHSQRDGSGGPIACRTDHYFWEGSGAALASIRIRCPACGMQKELSEIYSANLPCNGHRPEREGFEREQCIESAVVVQRGSFQLRLPEVITSLTIPPLVNPIHRTLQRGDVQAYIDAVRSISGLNAEHFNRGLQSQQDRNHIPRQVVDELRNTPWPELEEAIAAIESVSTPRSRSEYLQQEHEALTNVVETGFPPYPAPADRRPGEPISFQVDRHAIRRDVSSPNGRIYRVMPIERLRVVIVQTGYRRVHYTGPDAQLPTSNRGTHPLHQGQSWIPGVEQFGEGVFVDLNPHINGQDGWYPTGPSVVEWDRAVNTPFDRSDLIRWNALSTWWHSFSHRLINAMSLHSGYSSTAIRERIYLRSDERGRMYGGILLYTTQPGGDGTMGGLTSLVHQFENIIRLSLNGLDRCSNDPLCENAEIDAVSKLGAACYSCEMVSETSCEHYNGYLNRRLLLDNLP